MWWLILILAFIYLLVGNILYFILCFFPGSQDEWYIELFTYLACVFLYLPVILILFLSLFVYNLIYYFKKPWK